MNDDGSTTQAMRSYAAAYAAHYSERDLATALQLYRDLIDSHANALEAGYARTQIQNIVRALIPAEDLLDAQVELALAHIERA